MTRQEAIKEIESLLRCIERTKIEICKESQELWQLSLAALRDQEERENPQRLTIEQMKGMDCPVWVSYTPNVEGGSNGQWCLCEHGRIITRTRTSFDVEKIPDWKFYRYEKKEI